MLRGEGITVRSARGPRGWPAFRSATQVHHKCSTVSAQSRNSKTHIRAPAWTPAATTINGQEAAAAVATAAQPAPEGPQPFAWECNWWPVQVVSNLDPSRPTPTELLGMQLVLWRDASGTWRCFRDSCPHRRVPLAEGRVEGGELVCSYHGWRFDQGGACTAIPQAPDAKSLAAATASPRSCVTSFPTQVAAGLLWVWPDSSPAAVADAAAAQPPLPNVLQQDVYRQQLEAGWFYRQMPYDFDVLLENVADPSHVPFSHHGAFPGLDRNTAPPMPFQPLTGSLEKDSVLDLLPSGVAPACAYKYPSQTATDNRILFYPPGFVTISAIGRLVNLIYVIPCGPGRSAMITAAAFMPPPPGSQPFIAGLIRNLLRLRPTYLGHAGLLKFFDGDIVFLHAQGRFLRSLEQQQAGARWPQEYFMPMTCDGAVVTVRKWFDQEGGGGPAYPAGAAPTTPLTREQLLDRLGQHTKHCTHCRQGLDTADRLVAASKVLLGAAFFALCCLAGTHGLPKLLAGGLPSVGTAAAIVGGLVALRLQSAGEWLRKELTFTDFAHADIP